ncbi:MAG TPA: DUF1499 domain-containing protein [Stellaceae bacterium]
MTAAATRARPGRNLFRLAPPIGLILAAGAVLLLALGPVGWRWGWWDLRFSLLGMMTYSAYLGGAAVVVGAIGLAAGRHGRAIAVIAIVVGALTVYVPWHYEVEARSVPPIHDITTDTANPPAFVAAVPLRKAESGNPASYEGARVAALQKKGYPDLAPLTTSLAPPEAFATALAAAKEMGWTILATDPQAGRIEASQRSFWYGFTDDIVVRVAAAGAGSRIDVRSSARHGRSDLGVNAARIRAYLARLKKETGG